MAYSKVLNKREYALNITCLNKPVLNMPGSS